MTVVTDGAAPGPVLERKPGLAEVLIDDSVVIYDPGSLSCHLLNSSAGVIWQLIDGRRTTEDMLRELEQMFPDAAGDLASDLATGVEQITSSGLIADGEDGPTHPEPVAPVPATAGEAAETAPATPAAVASASTFRGIDYAFAISGPDDVQASLTKSLRTLASTDPPERTYAIAERTANGARQLEVSLDGDLVGTAGRPGVGDVVLQNVNQQVSAASDRFLLVHASAVLTTRGVLAFAGTTNAGKSTLVTGLVKAGFPYVTDEAVAVSLGGLEVVAYPKPIGIDVGSYPLFPELKAAANDLATHRWWINPLDVGPGTAAVPNRSTHTLAGVVFVQYEDGRALSTESVDPPEAAVELTRNLFNLAAHPQSGLETVALVTTEVPCWRVGHSDLDTMVEWVRAHHQPAPLDA